MTDKPVHVIASLTVSPDTVEQFWDLARGLIEPCRGEEGNRSYVALRDVDEPTRFVFVEEWQSRTHFDEHLASPHLLAHDAATRGMIASPLEVSILESGL